MLSLELGSTFPPPCVIDLPLSLPSWGEEEGGTMSTLNMTLVISTARSYLIYQTVATVVIYGLGVFGPTTAVLAPLDLPESSTNQHPWGVWGGPPFFLPPFLPLL